MSIYVRIEEAAQAIGLSPSTIKKYYLLIEEQGYRFKRNNQGQLIFSQQDIEMFQKIVILKNEPGMSVQKAVQKVVTSITAMTVYREKEDTDTTDRTVVTEDFLKEILRKHQEEMRELVSRYEKEMKEIKEEVKDSKLLLETKENDRDKLWMQSLRETQEVKKLMLEMKEQMAAAKESGKKKWWEIWK